MIVPGHLCGLFGLNPIVTIDQFDLAAITKTIRG
jgi:hypothetical protein